jgi:hypothetical protein
MVEDYNCEDELKETNKINLCIMKEKKAINVYELNNTEDFYYFLENEPLFDEDLLFGDGDWKLALRESLLIKSIEIRKKALDRARKIGEFDDSNDSIWWDIYDSLEQGIDHAQYELENVQNYLAREIEEITPEVAYQDALRERRKIKIRYMKYICITVALTAFFSIKAFIVNPWLVILPILIGAIIIFIQTIYCSMSIEYEIPYIF